MHDWLWKGEPIPKETVIIQWFEMLSKKISSLKDDIEDLRKENELQAETIMRIYKILYPLEVEMLNKESKLDIAQLKEWVKSTTNNNLWNT